MHEVNLKEYEKLREKGQISNRHLTILNILYNSKGLTDREITELLGKSDPNFVRPRRKELLDMCLVKENGFRMCTVTGKNVHLWATTKFMPEIIPKEKKKVHQKEEKTTPCNFCNGRGYWRN